MTTAQLWTILGPLLGVFGVLVVLIIQQGNSLRSDLTARIDQQTARIDQVVKDIGELKGDVKIVKDRLKIPMSA
jgi:predicted PurR-regulated permease PerM